jgi:hypothetical protein
MSLRITFKEASTSNSPTPTGRRLQPPSFSGYNLREAPTPQFYSYNKKEATTPYVLRLQLEGGYNHLSFPRLTALKYKCQMMKPCHTIPVRYTTIRLYQSVPTTCNQPVPKACNQYCTRSHPIPTNTNRYMTCICCISHMYVPCLYCSLRMYVAFLYCILRTPSKR